MIFQSLICGFDIKKSLSIFVILSLKPHERYKTKERECLLKTFPLLDCYVYKYSLFFTERLLLHNCYFLLQ